MKYIINESSLHKFIYEYLNSLDRGQAMKGIAMWFEHKFDVTVYEAREWDW